MRLFLVLLLTAVVEYCSAVRCYHCAETEKAFEMQSSASCTLYPKSEHNCAGCVRYHGRVTMPSRLPRSFVELIQDALRRDSDLFLEREEKVVVRACWRFDRQFVHPLAPYNELVFSNKDLMRKLSLKHEGTIERLGMDPKGNMRFCFTDRCNY